jgi:hypothetical protein
MSPQSWYACSYLERRFVVGGSTKQIPPYFEMAGNLARGLIGLAAGTDREAENCHRLNCAQPPASLRYGVLFRLVMAFP